MASGSELERKIQRGREGDGEVQHHGLPARLVFSRLSEAVKCAKDLAREEQRLGYEEPVCKQK
jgi:hypothetical protein